MNKPILLALGLVLAGGCAETPRPLTAPVVRAPVTTVPRTAVPRTAAAPPASVPAAPPSAAATGASPGATPPGPPRRVVEVITKPVLVTPSTRASTPGRPAALPAGRPAGAGGAAPDVPTPKLTLDDAKRLDAAVSCAPVTRLLAMKLNGIPYQRFAGYGALDFTPALPEGTNPDAMTNDVLGREPGGTAAAIRRLVRGEADLVLAPRLPDAAENAAAAAAKVRVRADLVATEALVFTVNAANPLSGLSRDQLEAIFTGRTKAWKDLGPATLSLSEKIASEPITVAYRARGTGSEELLQQLLLGGKPVPELPISKALSSSKLVLDASLEDPETIGFSVFAYATNMQRDGRVKVLAVEGVLPEPARVASGEYPLTTPIYVLTRGDLSSDSNLFKLRDWLGSMAGQKTLAEAGYMPVSGEAWTAVRLMGK